MNDLPTDELELDYCSQEDLRFAMDTHAMNCERAFHRNCLEFIILCQHWIHKGNRIETWDPWSPRDPMKVNYTFHCLSPDSTPIVMVC